MMWLVIAATVVAYGGVMAYALVELSRWQRLLKDISEGKYRR